LRNSSAISATKAVAFIRDRLHKDGIGEKAILLIDEVEQAYLSVTQRVRADDRSPLRAWLEEETFKVFAFAAGSLYVLGRADRERLTVRPIPPIHPEAVRKLFPNLPSGAVNGMWWLSRGKPRHFMKAVRKYELTKPVGSVDVQAYVSSLDSVSQAPFEGESQSVVPAAYLDQLEADEVCALVQIGFKPEGRGKLIPISQETENALLSILKEAFKLETVAFDLVRYVLMLADAVSIDGQFALTELDTPYLLRMAVDFLLEYERERLEKDTMEGNAALRKLLEVHDRAGEKAGEVFWKLHGWTDGRRAGTPVLSFQTLASTFPLPTTSPTLFGTDPTATRTKFEEQKQPVFEWTDQTGNQVLFLTSPTSLYSYSSSKQFRQLALSPTGGVLVFLPHDTEHFHLTGLLGWLHDHKRLHIQRLPLALSDFLLSLRAFSPEGRDPIAVAALAENRSELKRQVAFYRSRLQSFTAEMSCKPQPIVPSPLPSTLGDLESRVADKGNLALTICQAFEVTTPVVLGYLADLRSMVLETRKVWDRKVAPGFVALADSSLPHKSTRTGRPEAAKIVDDVRAAFSTHRDALAALASHVDSDEMDTLSKDRAGQIALQALWKVKRGIAEEEIADLNIASRQLSDVAQVLSTLYELELQLRQVGVSASLGDLGAMVEARSAIETVAKHADELIKGKMAAEKQLARAIYNRFLQGFLLNVAGDVSSAKTTASKLHSALENITVTRERLTTASLTSPVLFAEINPATVAKFSDELLSEHIAAVSKEASLETVLSSLEDAEQDLTETEERIAELSEAYERIRSLLQEMANPNEH